MKRRLGGGVTDTWDAVVPRGSVRVGDSSQGEGGCTVGGASLLRSSSPRREALGRKVELSVVVLLLSLVPIRS